MAKPEGVDWVVREELKRGEKLDKWIAQKDSVELEPDLTFKVDESGLFLAWKADKKDWVVQDLNLVRDIRPGKRPKDENLLNILIKKHGEDFHRKSLNISTGTGMVIDDNFNVVFSDHETAAVWKKGLRELTNNSKVNNLSPLANLQKQWLKLRMMVSGEGNILVKNICKSLQNTSKVEKIVQDQLKEVGVSAGSIDREMFTFEMFYKIYAAVCPRNDINQLISSINGAKPCDHAIKCQEFVEFLNKKQRDPRLNEILYAEYNEKRAMEVIAKYENNASPGVLPENFTISRDGFFKYLLSDENSPVFLDRLRLYQDMDQPLSHYYINSSHNTYLTGRQFKGKSSVKMYRQVLLSGCRCIELDCWDGNGEDQEPKITHGMCMCTDIPFKDVIYAIKDCAFTTSEYPLILSFENHCSRPQQQKMAKYCDEILGDLLLKEPLDEVPLIPGVPLPSPNQLKRKILIKNKRLEPEVEKIELELYRRGDFSLEESEEQKEDSLAASHQELSIEGTLDDASMENGGIALPVATTHQSTTQKIHPYLSSMVNYTTPIKFLGFQNAEDQNMSFKMSTFGETQALGYLNRQEPSDMVNYNKRQLSRIYPKGKRVDSSNYMPQLFWNAGCQMVSLNFQTADIPMQLNQGKFEYNGNCGYILKPDIMRREDRQFDPFSMTSMDGVIAAQCKIQVISGQFLSDKTIGTYVKLDMYGLPVDTFKKEFKTKLVPSNGINPVYNEEPFEFRKVVMPELAVLRFGAFDESGKLLGQRILPFDDLRTGYRHITLRTETNQPIPLAMLFCHIELDVYITDEHEEMIQKMVDPMAFLSKQEKRMEQLRSMGYSESDIGTDIVETSEKQVKKPEVAKDIAEIIRDLQQEKGYRKIIKKQQKELELLKSKHQKEELELLKSKHQSIVKGKSTKDLLTNSLMPLVGDITTNQIGAEQKNKLAQILDRQGMEEKGMKKHHISAQETVLKTLLEAYQEKEIKEQEVYLEKMNKELYSSQAKLSIETAKNIQSDKTFNKKSQKVRRLKEISENNTKKFIQEREAQSIEHNKKREHLKKIHRKQMEDLNEYFVKVQVNVIENHLIGCPETIV